MRARILIFGRGARAGGHGLGVKIRDDRPNQRSFVAIAFSTGALPSGLLLPSRGPFPARMPGVNRSFNFAALPLVLCWATALADPGYYVVTVYDDPGVKTADFRYWTVKAPGSSAVTWPEVGIGWNVNGRWYTEVLASYVGSSDFATRLSTLNWQNDVLLTQG